MAFAGFTIIFLISSAFVISILLVARSIRRVNNDDGTKKNMFRRVTVVLGIVLSTAAFVTASSLVVWFVHGWLEYYDPMLPEDSGAQTIVYEKTDTDGSKYAMYYGRIEKLEEKAPDKNFQRTQNNKRDAVYVFENGHWCWIFDYASGEYEIDGDIYGYK